MLWMITAGQGKGDLIWSDLIQLRAAPVSASVPHNGGMSLSVLHNATIYVIYKVEESLLPSFEQVLLCLINYTVVTKGNAHQLAYIFTSDWNIWIQISVKK